MWNYYIYYFCCALAFIFAFIADDTALEESKDGSYKVVPMPLDAFIAFGMMPAISWYVIGWLFRLFL